MDGRRVGGNKLDSSKSDLNSILGRGRTWGKGLPGCLEKTLTAPQHTKTTTAQTIQPHGCPRA